MEAIKHSRIIIVLLILYIGISIIVVTMDASQTSKKSNKSDSANTTEKDKKTIDVFREDVNNIHDNIDSFLENSNLTTSACISFKDMLGEDYTGSAYVNYNNGYEIRVWYSNGTYAINNFDINTDITEENVEQTYSTPYYETCGLSQ